MLLWKIATQRWKPFIYLYIYTLKDALKDGLTDICS